MASDAVLLVAFGGPERAEDVRPFLAEVLRGRPVPPARIEEVVHHYEVIGGRSPLNELTFRQAAALGARLRERGDHRKVYVGMRNWAPRIADTLAAMADDGVREAVTVLLSPHATEASRARYGEALEAGRTRLGPRAPALRFVAPWFVHPGFVGAAAARTADALATLPTGRRADATMVFTAHSVPTAMAAESPYVEEITATARAVAERLGHRRWQLAWQSRSGSPLEPWVEPDVNDVLRALASTGVRDVVVVPIGFVCDHVEVLYDLDVEARATAATLGLGFARAATVSDHPEFIAALADVIREASG
jgi:ferrochelatase